MRSAMAALSSARPPDGAGWQPRPVVFRSAGRGTSYYARPQIIRTSIDRLKPLDGHVLAGHDGISSRLRPSRCRCGTADLHPEHRDKHARHRDRDCKIEDGITHEIPLSPRDKCPSPRRKATPKRM